MSRVNHPFTTSGDSRRRELARIHCLARDLGLDREAYEHVLATVTGAASAGELDAAGRRTLIAHLHRKLPRRDNRADPDAPHNLAGKPLLRKIGALLAEAERPWAYAEALARRIGHRQRLAFCADADLRKIVAALIYDRERRARRATRRDA